MTTYLINQLIKGNAIYLNKRYGSSNAINSPIIFDFDQIISSPMLLESVSTLYSNSINKPFEKLPDYIIASSNIMIPIATIISIKFNIPMLMINDKQHIIYNKINNSYTVATVLVIDDIIMTGTNHINIITLLRNNGMKPINMICLAKISSTSLGIMHGMEATRGIVPIKSLLSLKDIEFQIKFTKGKYCRVIDARDMSELESKISKIYRKTSIIKFNIDLIRDFDPSTSPKQLLMMKNRYGVLLWESRIFYDSVSVIRRQLTQGIHKISSWADIVSIHYMVGCDILKISSNYINGCKIIVTGHILSKHDEQLTEQTIEQTLNIIDPLRENLLNKNIIDGEDNTTNNPIIGIVTNKDIKTNLLKVTPNIDDPDTMVPGNDLPHTKWIDIIVVE